MTLAKPLEEGRYVLTPSSLTHRHIYAFQVEGSIGEGVECVADDMLFGDGYPKPCAPPPGGSTAQNTGLQIPQLPPSNKAQKNGQSPPGEKMPTQRPAQPAPQVQSSAPSTSSPVAALSVNGLAARYTTQQAPFQPTISVTGTGFNSIKEIRWLWISPSNLPGTAIWRSDDNFDGKLVRENDRLAEVSPVLVAAGDSVGVYHWKVIFVSDDGQQVTRSFTVHYTSPQVVPPPPPVAALQVNGLDSTYTTSSKPYTPTVRLSGEGLDRVTEIRWSWSGPNSGSTVWTPGSRDWPRFLPASDGRSATVSPNFIADNDPAGAWYWTVAFIAGTQRVEKNFSVTYARSASAGSTTPASGTPWRGIVESMNSFKQFDQKKTADLGLYVSQAWAETVVGSLPRWKETCLSAVYAMIEHARGRTSYRVGAVVDGRSNWSDSVGAIAIAGASTSETRVNFLTIREQMAAGNPVILVGPFPGDCYNSDGDKVPCTHKILAIGIDPNDFVIANDPWGGNQLKIDPRTWRTGSTVTSNFTITHMRMVEF
ncbi:hypothetical protein [Parvibaculum sp.]|uniref:hypothetical protein n=1 Tax=Parvibaculum sp. TaxID=2024848 RepID=UPI001DFCA0ED|nr:hypothetical protein [Parvibaculum sp.]MBX3489993.1 hypothetical protein [Parvibaculum sp.]MCW5726019.1 hypothetical protein [Parvibaculum sp.]